MKFCRILLDRQPAWGRVEEGQVVLLAGDPFAGWCDTLSAVPLADVVWLPPVVPNTFFCAGLNYRTHIDEAAKKGYPAAKIPEHPDVGYRANNALTGHNGAIIRPSDFDGRFEYEGELVAVIGKPLRHATRQQAIDGIFGWTIGNDVSAREWQRSDRTFWRGKNADTFKPMGPWIDTEATPLDGKTRVSLNGVLDSEYNTGAMIFDPYEFIVAITRYITMSPGDVLWLGTDATHEMQVGDLVEIEITGLGTLANPVVAENLNERT